MLVSFFKFKIYSHFICYIIKYNISSLPTLYGYVAKIHHSFNFLPNNIHFHLDNVLGNCNMILWLSDVVNVAMNILQYWELWLTETGWLWWPACARCTSRATWRPCRACRTRCWPACTGPRTPARAAAPSTASPAAAPSCYSRWTGPGRESPKIIVIIEKYQRKDMTNTLTKKIKC